MAFETKRGMIALEYGQVLLKLFPGTFMVISEEEFNEYFVEDECMAAKGVVRCMRLILFLKNLLRSLSECPGRMFE